MADIITRQKRANVGTCDECGETVGTTAQIDVGDGEYKIDLCAACCLRLAEAILQGQ